MENDPNSIYEAMVLHDDACFLCGSVMGEDATKEHVFPKWLQQKHDLWNLKLTLMNQTLISYRLLTVPCCRKCNNNHLGALENEIRQAFDSGYEKVKAIPSIKLNQWIGKIFYGLLRKELRLYTDIRDKEKGTIIPKELLENFSSLHQFLQSIRTPFSFREEHFSVLVVNLYYESPHRDYFFRGRFNSEVQESG